MFIILFMKHTFVSFATRGLEADLVKVEVDHYSGHPGMVIVGLGDVSVHESRERVRAALKNSGFRFPRGRVVVNLAPADTPKVGPCFDLPIALGLVGLHEAFDQALLSSTAFFGELALDGSLRHVDGILGMVSAAAAQGYQRVYVPSLNAQEASLIRGMKVFGIDSLSQVVSHLQGEIDLEGQTVSQLKDFFTSPSPAMVDFSAIRGQSFAKRALEIAAAGGHNILMSGSPGSGKSLLAKAFQGILPQMTLTESLEVTKLYSLSGLLPEGEFLVRHRPFRTVHHTASGASLVGGGRIPRPGEISLAHRGVLFIDEMAEFSSHKLDLLRQPLEDRQITISRTSGTLTYPAQFVLVAAMNPCPCGYYQVAHTTRVCTCTPSAVIKYQSKVSGPMMDRIDLFCRISPVSYSDLQGPELSEPTSAILTRVESARSLQLLRFSDTGTVMNSEMTPKQVMQYCPLTPSLSTLLERSMTTLQFSVRSYHRILKVARTIADLARHEDITQADLCEALQYRHS